jgi:hypothetical protein
MEPRSEAAAAFAGLRLANRRRTIGIQPTRAKYANGVGLRIILLESETAVGRAIGEKECGVDVGHFSIDPTRPT